VSDLGLIAAAGIGQAIGIGGVATLAARRVPEPQAARIGLVALPWRAWPMILLLAPAVLIASELDNIAYDWSPKSETVAEATDPTADTGTEAEKGTEAKATAQAKKDEDEQPERLIDPDDPFSVMEGLIVVVGIAPVVEEFLFRGVLQQGLVARLGMARGVTLVALLWTMLRPVPATSPARFAAAFIAAFGLGWLLGMMRLWSGSILGSMVLASTWAAVGFASLAFEQRHAIPGMNVEGTHLPAWVTLVSVLLVAWAAQRIFEEARREGDALAG
jgi:Type II CAAX prenyl endopeptidase Rce1-like